MVPRGLPDGSLCHDTSKWQEQKHFVALFMAEMVSLIMFGSFYLFTLCLLTR